jgi:hypothetical protein
MKSLSIYLLPLIGLIFYSCIDDPVNPDGNIVKVGVFDESGIKIVSISDLYYISPGNEPISFVPYFSDIILDTYKSPYDIVITSYLTNISIKYHNVTSKNINPVFFDPEDYSGNSSSYRSIVTKIVFPQVSSETKMFAKFISNEIYYQNKYIYALHKGDSLLYLELAVPRTNRNEILNGHIMIIEAENWHSNNQINFKRFGLKQADSIYDYCTVKFSEAELGNDPQEVNTNFKNIAPQGAYSSRNNLIAISFTGYSGSNDLILYRQIYDEETLPIPILPINYQIKYTGTYMGGGMYYEQYAFKYVLLEPGQSGTIIHKEPISLLYPGDKDSNVNGSTEFRINDNEPGGIYMYDFVFYTQLANRKFRLFSSSKQLKFSDITARGFESIPNGRYFWWVSKLPEFQDVNDLLNTPYVTDPKFNSLQMSERRTFYTGP